MEDVLSVYERPYDVRYPVLCVDEGRKELRAYDVEFRHIVVTDVESAKDGISATLHGVSF